MIFAASLLPLLGCGLVACNDELTTIGSSLSKGEVVITMDSIETVLSTSTRLQENIDSRSYTKLLGRISVPEYGSLGCSFVTQMGHFIFSWEGRFNNVLHCFDIGFDSFFGIPVGRRGNHATYMKDYFGIIYPFFHSLLIEKVAPYHADSFLNERSKFFSIFLGVASKDGDLVFSGNIS